MNLTKSKCIKSNQTGPHPQPPLLSGWLAPFDPVCWSSSTNLAQSAARILDPGGRIALQRAIVNEENVWEMKNMHALVWNKVMLTKLVFRAMAWTMLYLVLHGGPQGFPYMFGSVQTYCRSIGMVVQAIQEQKDPKGSPNILQRPPKPADQGKIYVTILLKRQGQTMTEAR